MLHPSYLNLCEIALLALQRYGTGQPDTRCCILITIYLLHGVAFTQSDNMGIAAMPLIMHVHVRSERVIAMSWLILNPLTDVIR